MKGRVRGHSINQKVRTVTTMEPLWQSALLALGLIACLCGFLSLKRDLYILARKYSERAAPSPAVARSGFTSARRAQALRRLGQGEDAARIAATMGIPLPEVELLSRVQRMMASYAAESAAEAPPSAAHATRP